MARATLDRYQASAITEMRWAADGSFNCGIGQARFEFQMPKGNSSSVKFIGRIQNGFSKFDLVCETLSNNYDLRINKFCRKLDLSHRFSHKEPSKNLIVVPKWLWCYSAKWQCHCDTARMQYMYQYYPKVIHKWGCPGLVPQNSCNHGPADRFFR